MSKIRLSIEDLSVESFTTCAAEGRLGTVHGNAKTDDACIGATQFGLECETYYGNGACSAHDGCASAPHGWTPCAGCVETDHLCVIDDGGVLG